MIDAAISYASQEAVGRLRDPRTSAVAFRIRRLLPGPATGATRPACVPAVGSFVPQARSETLLLLSAALRIRFLSREALAE